MNGKTSTNDHKKTLLDGLRDPIWQFVGAVFGVLAIFITCYFFLVEREVKALQVVILARMSLVEVEETIAEDIVILYKDQPIADLALFQMKMENTGNQAICPEDYAQPIKFVFPPQTQVIEAAVVETSPLNIGVGVQVEQNTATLSQVLLNPTDRAIIRFLVTNMPIPGDAPPFNVDARIAEVKDVPILDAIEERDDNELKYTILACVVIAMVAILILAWQYARMRLRYSQRTEEELKKALREVVVELVEVKTGGTPSKSGEAHPNS